MRCLIILFFWGKQIPDFSSWTNIIPQTNGCSICICLPWWLISKPMKGNNMGWINMINIQFPCEKKPVKNTSKSTNNSCTYCISMEFLTCHSEFPLIFVPFANFSSGSFSGPGGGTQARNWPMLSSKRCFLTRRIAFSMLQWSTVSCNGKVFLIIWGTPIMKWCCTFWLYSWYSL